MLVRSKLSSLSSIQKLKDQSKAKKMSTSCGGKSQLFEGEKKSKVSPKTSGLSLFIRSDEINSCDCEGDIKCMNCRRKELFGNNMPEALPLPKCFPIPSDLPKMESFSKFEGFN